MADFEPGAAAPVENAPQVVAPEPTTQAPEPTAGQEGEQTPEANREGGVMYRMLALKQMHPGPDSGAITNPDLDFSLDRTDTCTRAETFDDYASKHSERGMPFGMPPSLAAT